MVALPGAALPELITASTILPALVYGAVIVLCPAVRRRPGRREGAFGLGRLELPVAVCAPARTMLALFVPVTPREALVPVVVVAGLLLLGGLFFPGMLLSDRRSLDAEPGADTDWWRPRPGPADRKPDLPPALRPTFVPPGSP
ncbi:hypothetical protein ACFQ7Z_01925 [Streptomyces virginiae]|uniref:hypothetical protein n=1 Tax=Streptomyces virginiae TaxID=1961 RepID=UPI003687CC34